MTVDIPINIPDPMELKEPEQMVFVYYTDVEPKQWLVSGPKYEWEEESFDMMFSDREAARTEAERRADTHIGRLRVVYLDELDEEHGSG